MNKTIEAFIRDKLKVELAKCAGVEIRLLKLIYSPLDSSSAIAQFVDAIPADKLEAALSQVENTLAANLAANVKNGLCSYCGHPRNGATCQRQHP